MLTLYNCINNCILYNFSYHKQSLSLDKRYNKIVSINYRGTPGVTTNFEEDNIQIILRRVKQRKDDHQWGPIVEVNIYLEVQNT